MEPNPLLAHGEDSGMTTIRDLLSQGNLTQARAAEIAGCSPRTMRRWIAGECSIPHPAWAALTAHVEQQAAIAAALADAEAFEAQAQSAAPPSLAETIAALKSIADAQYHAVCVAEDTLAAARREHEQTMRRLNALYAERGKG